MKKILPISIGIAVLAWVSYFFWSSSWHTEGELWGIEPNIVDPSADVSARLSGLFYGDIHVDLPHGRHAGSCGRLGCYTWRT